MFVCVGFSFSFCLISLEMTDVFVVILQYRDDLHHFELTESRLICILLQFTLPRVPQ